MRTEVTGIYSGKKHGTRITRETEFENNAPHHYEITGSPAFPGMSVGITRIDFQNGPIKAAGVNGIFEEHLLAIAIDRLQHFQNSPYSCRENALALTHLQEAFHWLKARTEERELRQVEGTHEL